MHRNSPTLSSKLSSEDFLQALQERKVIGDGGLVMRFLAHQPLRVEEIRAQMDRLPPACDDTITAYLKRLKTCIVLTLLGARFAVKEQAKLYEELHLLFLQQQKQGFPSQVPLLFEEFFLFLMKKAPPKQTMEDKGTDLVLLQRTKEDRLPYLNLAGEIVLILLTLQKNLLLCERIMRGYLALFDTKGRCLSAAWAAPKEWDSPSASLLFSLVAYKMGDDDLAERLFSATPPTSALSPFSFLLIHYCLTHLKRLENKRKLYPDLSTFSPQALLLRDTPIEGIATPFGYNSSVGVLHKKQGGILAFGPNTSPLDQLDNFGLYRPFHQHAGHKDVDLGQKHVKGWTTILRGQHKAYLTLENTPDCLKHTFQLFPPLTTTSLFYVFFIDAADATVNHVLYKQKSLNQFSGPATCATFSCGAESLQILPRFEGHMQLIPLEGERYFFGAKFLLAFPLPSAAVRYCWTMQ